MEDRTMLTKMERARSNIEGTLQLIYDVCLPDDENIVRERSPGGRRRYPLYASTAPNAAKRLANFIHAIMMPESGMWGNQRPVDENLFNERTVQEWFWNANLQMSQALSVSNFYPKSLETTLDLVVAGIGALYGEMNTKIADENGSRFKSATFQAIPIANFFYLEATADDEERGIRMGDPNRVARVLDMEAGEIRRVFGVEPETLKDAEENDMFRLAHIVAPNHAMTGDANRWVSRYLILGKADSVPRLSAAKEAEVVSDGVLPRMPYFVPRMAQKSGELWPRGFGLDALQDILEENVLTKHMLNSIGKDADPPTIVGHEAAMHLELIAGGVSYMDPDRFDQIKQFRSEAQYAPVFQRIDKLEMKIKEHFLIDQLQLPQRLDRATAEEVITRREDATNALSSTLQKVEREFPAKVMDWLFEGMLELGAFGETPEAMAGGADTVVMFDSPMANARRRRQLEPIRRYRERIYMLARETGDQSIADPINNDAISKAEQRLEGFDPAFFRTDEEVKKIREDRIAAAQRAEAREAVKVLPDAANAAATAKQAGFEV